jgi:electron transfer flavoprotein alpha subunit
VLAAEAETPTPTTLHEVRTVASDVDGRVVVREWIPRGGGVSLANARVVVGGGRGVGGEEGFAAIDELAALLGAAVGVSRVVTSAGWRPHAQQVGQTGTKISPDLYLACGISGATQHLAGCRSAKHVVAINVDAEAPFLARADYAIVGDLNVIVPAISDAIRSRASS